MADCWFATKADVVAGDVPRALPREEAIPVARLPPGLHNSSDDAYVSRHAALAGVAVLVRWPMVGASAPYVRKTAAMLRH